MYPFIDLGFIKIPMYGLMCFLGTILAVALALFRKNRYNIQRDDLLYSACFAGVGVLVGSKLLYFIATLPHVLKNIESYSGDVKAILYTLLGGYVFYGGLIGGLIGGIIYGKIYKISPMRIIDSYAPSIPLLHAFGRIGCFFAGCCYGAPSEKYGVYFSEVGGAPQGVKLFPIQLVESGINFLVFLILFFVSRKKKLPVGFLTGLYLSIYAVERFILEFFRYDYIRGNLLGISTSQWISIVLLPVGIALMLFGRKIEKLFGKYEEV